VFDVKVTETNTSNLTMAQARIKERAVKTGESEKNVKFKAKVAAEGARINQYCWWSWRRIQKSFRSAGKTSC
jgi:hypothetical protein